MRHESLGTDIDEYFPSWTLYLFSDYILLTCLTPAQPRKMNYLISHGQQATKLKESAGCHLQSYHSEPVGLSS